MSDVIISLTTIPPRMAKLTRTLESLVAQTADIASVILWLPRQYRRREFDNYRVPDVPPGVEIRFCDIDYGPATKVLPAAREFRGRDVRLIYCDDDEVYSRDWADFLVRQSRRFPDDALTVNGMSVKMIDHLHFRTTRGFRLATLLTGDLYRRWYRAKAGSLRAGVGPVDICQGFSGVLVRPEFIPESAFEIPDILWLVDDVWLSGQMAVNGIRARRVAERKMCEKSEAASIADLTNLVHGGYDRINAEMSCVNYFREEYGIWK